MSKEIESRVVEMRFDNKQFMAGIKETLAGLLNLKKSLNMKDSTNAFKGLNKAANEVNFAGIERGVELLTKRFSTMGIVGMRVIENITDGVMGKLSSAVHMVTDSIKSGGLRRSMNLENAHFQLQALLKDEEKVQEVMDNANTAVDGTAYSLDEAAKAASQFAASGIQAGDEMVNALRGIVGTAAMTNDSFEHMSSIFTTVAGNGRLMGDQLLQLSAGGLNAASTIADFMNGIIDGSKEASEEVTNLVQSLTRGAKVTEGDIREMVTDGEISFKIFSEAMTEAFADSAERANETFTGAFANMKSALARIGAGFYSPLIAQNSEVVKLFNAVRVKINDVKKALVFDEAIGNVDALSKQTTDLILNLAKVTTKYVEDLDLSKPLEAFYYWVKAGQNSLKGFGQVLKPVATAFYDTFLNRITFDSLLDFSKGVEKLTQNFKFSKEETDDLHDAWKGLFDITKLLGDGIIDFIKIFIPVNEPLKVLGENFIRLSGKSGRALTEFTEWIRSSEKLKKSYDTVSKSVADFMYSVAHLDESVKKLKSDMLSIPIVNNTWKFLNETFTTMGKVFSPYVEEFGDYLTELGTILENTVSRETTRLYENFINTINNLGDSINNLDFSKASEKVEWFAGKLTKLFDMLASNDSLVQYIKNMGDYVKNGVEHLTLDNLYNALGKFSEYVSGALSYVSFDNFFKAIEMFREKVDNFLQWIKDKVGPVFGEFNFGGAFAIAGGGGIIFAILKLAKCFETLTKSVKSIPDSFKTLMGSIKDTLKAYQLELKANALIKLAGAIAIFAGALVLLSFADMDKVDSAAKTLVSVSTILILGFATLESAVHKGKDAEDAAYVLAKGFKRAMSKLAGAIRLGAMGILFSQFGTMMLKIVGSIVVLAIAYNKDKESVDAALKIIATIAGVAVSGMIILSKMSDKLKGAGSTNFAAAAIGVAAMAFAMLRITTALKEVFEMKLPDNEKELKTKLGIFGAIFVGLGVLIGVMQKASAGVARGAVKTGPILAIGLSLYLLLATLNQLFKMDIPDDVDKRLAIMAGLFLALGYVIKSVGKAAGMAGGSLKAFGTIISICVFLGVAVAALGFLALIPGDRLLHGAEALGLVLVALGLALRGAGKITEASSYKSVLAMAVTTGAIALALGLLSLVSWPALTKAVAALGAILLILSRDFEKAGKMHKKSTTRSIAAMVASVVVISGMLVVLAAQPWQGLVTAAGALSAVLLSFAKAFEIAGRSSGMSKKEMKTFLESMLIFIPIGVTLGILANQPWEGVMAAGIAISLVIKTFADTLKMISGRTGFKKEKVDEFLKASLTLIPIGIGLALLAAQPWEGILAAGAAMSGTILSFSLALKIMSGSKIKMPAIKDFALAMGELVIVAVILGVLAHQPWEGILAAGTAISEVVLSLSVALGIVGLVGTFAPGAQAGLLVLGELIVGLGLVVGVLGAFCTNEDFKNLMNGGLEMLVKLGEGLGNFIGSIVKNTLTTISSGLPDIANDLSEFMDNLKGFLDGAEKIENSTAVKIGILSRAIMLLAGAELVDAIASFISNGSSLSEFGTELSEFMYNMGGFLSAVSGVKKESMEAAKIMAEIVLMFAKTEFLEAVTGFMGGKSKSLSEFGTELKDFGEPLADFASKVSGITPDMVEGAAAATSILADMAKQLPKVDGFEQQIFGTNKKLSDFGEELVTFGYKIRIFAFTVQDITEDAVTGAVRVGELMAELATALPKQDGWVQKVLGQADLQTFGASITEFGFSIIKFQETVATLDTALIESVVEACKKLVELANTIEDPNAAYNIVHFSAGLESVAIDGIDRFCKAFEECNERVQKAIKDMIDVAIKTLEDNRDRFKLKGTAALVAWRNGFKAKHMWDTLKPLGTELTAKVLAGISVNLQDGVGFKPAGVKSSSMYIAGIKSLYSAAQNAGHYLAQNALNGIGEVSFFQAGANASQGFINGMNSKIPQVIAAGGALATAAYNATTGTLDEHSPSKKYFQAGDYGTVGFINGLLHRIGQVESTGEKIANASMSGLIDTISSDDLRSPVITPILDSKLFDRSANDMLSVFNNAAVDAAMDVRGVNTSMSAGSINEMDTLISAIHDLREGLSDMPRNTYQFGNIEYQDGDEVSSALETLVRAVKIRQRV